MTLAQAELRQAKLDHELYLRLGRQYRTVGDALVWQFYGFKALPLPETPRITEGDNLQIAQTDQSINRI
jgi:hypothetical protein